jgi:hypothetical protein
VPGQPSPKTANCAIDNLNPRFAGNAGVPPAGQLNSPVLAIGIGASRIHNIAYRFCGECRHRRHFAGGTPALPANRKPRSPVGLHSALPVLPGICVCIVALRTCPLGPNPDTKCKMRVRGRASLRTPRASPPAKSMRHSPEASALRELDFSGIVSPMQQRLSLPRPACEIPRLAVFF